jgi:hypothetical protein
MNVLVDRPFVGVFLAAQLHGFSACELGMSRGELLVRRIAHEIEDRQEAYDKADRYFERNGLDIPPSDSLEYREIFYYELDKIERGE